MTLKLTYDIFLHSRRVKTKIFPDDFGSVEFKISIDIEDFSC